jgi:hypothetical protein
MGQLWKLSTTVVAEEKKQREKADAKATHKCALLNEVA